MFSLLDLMVGLCLGWRRVGVIDCVCINSWQTTVSERFYNIFLSLIVLFRLSIDDIQHCIDIKSMDRIKTDRSSFQNSLVPNRLNVMNSQRNPFLDAMHVRSTENARKNIFSFHFVARESTDSELQLSIRECRFLCLSFGICVSSTTNSHLKFHCGVRFAAKHAFLFRGRFFAHRYTQTINNSNKVAEMKRRNAFQIEIWEEMFALIKHCATDEMIYLQLVLATQARTRKSKRERKRERRAHAHEVPQSVPLFIYLLHHQ